MSTLPKHVILKKHEEERLLGGHQWIFSNELHRVVGSPENGDVVEILRSDGRSLGIGFYNGASLIAVRFLSSSIEEIDETFFDTRIRAAHNLRKRLYPSSNTFRIVHGESDFLPGLIIDQYESLIAIQTFSTGMDMRLPQICNVIERFLHPSGIIERNESPLRTLEGLPLRKGIFHGSISPVITELNGVRLSIDILEGQKSGFFLDQRENRCELKPFVANRSVLDCFCNEGGFGLYAAAFGAAHVDSVDISDDSIAKAKGNAQLNNFTQMEFHTADVFQFLSEMVRKGSRWDVVILDPPSFTKSKKNVAAAVKGYKEINTNGLRLVSPGGIFVTASCSHHISREMFLNIVQESSVKAERRIKLLKFSGAAPDHPTLPSMPETHYLKFALFYVE